MLLEEGVVYRVRSPKVSHARIMHIGGKTAIGFILFKDGAVLWSHWDGMGMCKDGLDFEIIELYDFPVPKSQELKHGDGSNLFID